MQFTFGGEGKIKISEVFYSIQGEGIHQGLPMVFIRLQGCNLLNPGFGCSWCDTRYAQGGSLGVEMSIGEIAEKVREFSPHFKSWVCITGGEPLFQLEALEELVRKLKSWGYLIEIETNGSLPKPLWYTLVDSWVADIKCPSSGVCGISRQDWWDTRYCDQIKFVVGSREDLDFARQEIMKNSVKSPVVLVSPVLGPWEVYNVEDWGRDWLQEVAKFCIEMRVRMSLQLHKVIWGNRKGV